MPLLDAVSHNRCRIAATADFGTSGIAEAQERAPHCDDIVKDSAPGRVPPYITTNPTVDTHLYSVAGAYYWRMQQAMPHHAGSMRWDSLMHCSGPDTPVKSSAGGTWTSANSRAYYPEKHVHLHPAQDDAVETRAEPHPPVDTWHVNVHRQLALDAVSPGNASGSRHQYRTEPPSAVMNRQDQKLAPHTLTCKSLLSSSPADLVGRYL
ncbi:hypothetical protein ABZS81_26035 [Streptomyces sp. NPDC005318]|uniref:hypothetical protein n=1 Tax=Streptomyces sp. NPDC005318 TaxID=3157031 RepID=UPI0033A051D0